MGIVVRFFYRCISMLKNFAHKNENGIETPRFRNVKGHFYDSFVAYRLQDTKRIEEQMESVNGLILHPEYSHCRNVFTFIK